jgi:hypothetical protein
MEKQLNLFEKKKLGCRLEELAAKFTSSTVISKIDKDIIIRTTGNK